MLKGYYSRLYKIPIFILNEEEMDIIGRNYIWDKILSIAIWVDINIIQIECFDIIIER